MFDKSEYSEEQLWEAQRGRDETDIGHGNIDDLDPKKYGPYQMYEISLGRGDDSHANIDDLEPHLYDDTAMCRISTERARYSSKLLQVLADMDTDTYKDFFDKIFDKIVLKVSDGNPLFLNRNNLTLDGTSFLSNFFANYIQSNYLSFDDTFGFGSTFFYLNDEFILACISELEEGE